MTTCPRCGSDSKTIKQYPYRNKNVRCRNGWHNVGTRTMPRYIRSALGSSPLDHQQPGQGDVPIVEAMNKRIAEPSVKDKLQTVYDLCSPLGQKHILDIARQIGVELKTGENNNG